MKGGKDTSGKASQRKGADGERELAAVLREYGYEIKRGGSMSFGEVPDLVGLPGVHIEVKRCEQVRLSEWMQQAERDSQHFKDGLPAVFHRRSREGWRITMNLADFMRGSIAFRKRNLTGRKRQKTAENGGKEGEDK